MGGEEVLQLEESLGSGQVFSIGYARDGRFSKSTCSAISARIRASAIAVLKNPCCTSTIFVATFSRVS